MAEWSWNGTAWAPYTGSSGGSGGSTVATVAALAAAVAALQEQLDKAPYAVYPVSGAFQPRPVTPRPCFLFSESVTPTWGGTVSSGTGYVTGFDHLVRSGP